MIFDNLLIKTNENINDIAIPNFAIIGYKNDNNDFVDLKYFPINNNTISAEIPFSNCCLIDLKKCVNTINSMEKKELSFKGIIPKNIIYYKSKNIIWYVNSSKKYLYFSKSLSLKNGYYHLPRLLFAFINNKLSVFALKKGQIEETTKLFNAPFLNVYENGSICMGNVKTNISNFSYIENAIQYLESAFFKSVFTHTNHNAIIEGNIIEYFKELKEKNINFDTDKLILNQTKNIENLLKTI